MSRETHIVGFQVGRETYGVPINVLHEIVRVPEITAVPDVPDYLEGVINLRGKIVSVVDMRKRFGQASAGLDRRSRILVVEHRGRLVGMIVRMAEENRSWGDDRIVGALANLGHEVSDQTVGNVLQRHGLPPAPERKHTTTWATFIRAHLAVLAGTDFFTAEVLTLRGLVTYYVLFFIHLESRKVDIAGITVHPNERWMQQMARNVTMEECGTLQDCRYLLHDRDTKYTISCGQKIKTAGKTRGYPIPA